MNLNDTIERWLASAWESPPADRPFVTLSYAQSLDGSIALRANEPMAISGEQSLRLTHQLRSMHDGILVGIGTVLSDNPQLTVRHWEGKNPQPIVLDTHLRMPSDARLRQRGENSGEKSCWVLTTEENAWQQQEGIELCLLQPGADGRVCLNDALTLLYKKGIRHLMVEGGACVITAFLKARLADAVIITVAPKILGGYKAVGELDVQSSVTLPRLDPFFSERLDDDVILWGRLVYGDHQS